jgi:hypothetical protein
MMLTPAERAEKRAAWLTRIRNEIERRSDAVMTTDIGDPRAVLLAELAVMGERLRASPGYREPTAAEARRANRLLESWFKQRGYNIKLGG